MGPMSNGRWSVGGALTFKMRFNLKKKERKKDLKMFLKNIVIMSDNKSMAA